MDPSDDGPQSSFLRCPISRINFAPALHPTREQQLPHCHMITLRPVAPPHCPARPVQCAPRMGFSLQKVNFCYFGFKSSKSTARKRHRLALNPCIVPSRYYNTVKELPHLNQFCASYRSRSAKSKIQKCSRQRRVNAKTGWVLLLLSLSTRASASSRE